MYLSTLTTDWLLASFFPGTLVRPKEVTVVLIVIGLWFGAIRLFFNRLLNYLQHLFWIFIHIRWGKIRRMVPFIPPFMNVQVVTFCMVILGRFEDVVCILNEMRI